MRSTPTAGCPLILSGDANWNQLSFVRPDKFEISPNEKLPEMCPPFHSARMDHDQKLELAAAELAAALERIEDRGTCPDGLAELLLMVALGMRQEWPEQPE